ncbi:unnamed protein product, partial [Didymodactylos carnosus]
MKHKIDNTNFDSTYTNGFHGPQRFGQRSANMFFVRPARHIACPRRLKYIHDIKDSYIPYVEEDVMNEDNMRRRNSQKRNTLSDENAGLYNTADIWRQELMQLAQQVQTNFGLEENATAKQTLNNRRKSHSTMSCYSSVDDGHKLRKQRLLGKRQSSRQSSQQSNNSLTRVRTSIDRESFKGESVQEENHDAGIWLLPLLCYVLQTDNITDAQNWLVSANNTEKRLAMELIKRTMQDLNQENTTNDETTKASQMAYISDLFNVYWPYKILQRKERERLSSVPPSPLPPPPTTTKQRSKSGLSLPSLNLQNDVPTTSTLLDTCERATSPVRLVTPKYQTVERTPPTIVPSNSPRTQSRKVEEIMFPVAETTTHCQSQQTDRSVTERPPTNRSVTERPPTNRSVTERPPTNRSYTHLRRVATSMGGDRIDGNTPLNRGKTP